MTRIVRILITSLPIAILSLCGVMSGAEAQLIGDTPPAAKTAHQPIHCHCRYWL